jgi:hypothetical protein
MQKTFITICFIVNFLFLNHLAFASYQKIEPPADMLAFFNQIASIMNNRDKRQINDFYRYYAYNSAIFKKESEYIDNNDPERAILSEKLEMDVPKYIEYLYNILTPQSKYFYEYQIAEVQKLDDILYVTLNIKETMTRDIINKKTGKDETFLIVSISSCVYTLTYENAYYQILAMECKEKINKTIVNT